MALTPSFCADQNAASQTPPKDGHAVTQETIDQLPVSDRHCFEVSKETLQQLSKLKLKLPIRLQTASVMAQAYFEHVYGLCGAMKPPIESSLTWSFPCLVGVGAGAADSIVIEKATGRISCGSRESFESLSAFRGHLTLRSTRTQPARSAFLSLGPAFSSSSSVLPQVGPVSFRR